MCGLVGVGVAKARRPLTGTRVGPIAVLRHAVRLQICP